MLYRRGKIWWYKFTFCGCTYRESTKTDNRALAEKAERRRHQKLEESFNGVTLARPTPKLFSVAAEEWLTLKEGTLAPKSYGVEQSCLKHLKPYFGQRLLTDIDAAAIARYVGHRRKEEAADKTIKLELGTLRGILRRAKLWAAIADDDLLPKLRDRDDVGRAITTDEESALLAACRASRSRGLYTAVVIALNTGMRETEIRTANRSGGPYADRGACQDRGWHRPCHSPERPPDSGATDLGEPDAGPPPGALRVPARAVRAARREIPRHVRRRSHEADRQLENRVAECPHGRRGLVSLPRSPTQRLYTTPRRRRIVSDCREFDGLESEHDDEDGKALRPHRQSRASGRSQDAGPRSWRITGGHKGRHSGRRNGECDSCK
jgi:hypothetical protein